MLEKVTTNGNYIYHDDSVWKKHFIWKPMKVNNKLTWLRWVWKRHIVFGYPQLKTQYLAIVKEND